MHKRLFLLVGLVCLWGLPGEQAWAASAQVLGWNNLGMHCMDSDYSVFSILPPYNTINAQLIVAGKLVTNGSGYSVTYEAVADPTGSINTTSEGKGNWLQNAPLLYGAVAANQGLPFPNPDTFWMPGTNNVPQGMLYDDGLSWFYAYGVPMTPYDDAGNKNTYPMMRLIAKNGATSIATNDIVLPVSDEMDCRACHASGAQAAAQPAAGWVWSDNPERDFRLNILRRHDEQNFARHRDLYVSALTAKGFNQQGLYRGVVADGKPVLCAQCHASEALGTGSYSNIPPLTASIHSLHAGVQDPELNFTLDHSDNRNACYRCHPGSTTKCLRGAMGGSVASDGSMAMQCQSCHGGMSNVGKSTRTGWLNEPTCQQCHTGTATSNNGQIRYTTCFVDATNWIERVAVNQTFATKSNAPASGLSLYRFSTGHGGLECEACHGSTHAEFPATHQNDNVRNEKIQGHAGVMVECVSCHTSSPVNYTGGPHGMHPVGSDWVSAHPDFTERNGSAQCKVCHGADLRGTVLSRMQANRTLNAFGTKTFARGDVIGCYTCHNGASSETASNAAVPVASNLATNTANDRPLVFLLPVSGTNVTTRIVSQTAHGSVGLSNGVATYFPEAGFVGTDTFTYSAWNGSKNSLLATGTVAVVQGVFGIAAKALVPPSYPARWAVPFTALAAPVNLATGPSYRWNFGDGSPESTNQYATHAYIADGTFTWSLTATVGAGANVVATNISGVIIVGEAVTLAVVPAADDLSLTWPRTLADVLVEQSPTLGPDAHWSVVTNEVVAGQTSFAIQVPKLGQNFYRLKKL